MEIHLIWAQDLNGGIGKDEDTKVRGTSSNPIRPRTHMMPIPTDANAMMAPQKLWAVRNTMNATQIHLTMKVRI